MSVHYTRILEETGNAAVRDGIADLGVTHLTARTGENSRSGLLNAESADRPADHELLDLLSSLENVHGLSKPSSGFTGVCDLRFRL